MFSWNSFHGRANVRVGFCPYTPIVHIITRNTYSDGIFLPIVELGRTGSSYPIESKSNILSCILSHLSSRIYICNSKSYFIYLLLPKCFRHI